MLKQARAFGVGLVLATQNPVDLDYKALSNAGTWVIGRLQTEQDKNRLLDGLTSAAGGVDRAEMDKLISSIGKRVFLVQNVHAKTPVLIGTRWCLNYLAGPMTRTQIPAANALAGVKPLTAAPVAVKAEAPAASGAVASMAAAQAKPAASQKPAGSGYTSTRPGVPQGMDEVFYPNDLSFTQAAEQAGAAGTQSGLVYRPALLAQLQVNYLSRPYNLDTSRRMTALVEDEISGRPTWEDMTFTEQDVKSLKAQREPGSAQYDSLPGWLTDIKRLSQLQNDFEDWAYRTGTLTLLSNKSLKLNAAPDTKKEDFIAQCKKAAEDAAKDELAKIDRDYEAKASAVDSKIKKQELEISQKEAQANARRTDEIVKGASVVGNVLMGILGGKKSGISSAISGGSSTINKHRMAEEAAARVEQEKADMSALTGQKAALDKNKEADKAAVLEKWNRIAEDVQEVSVAPAKKDIYTELFGVAWLPYYTVKAGMEERFIPAYKR
jgi:hypothetical protein